MYGCIPVRVYISIHIGSCVWLHVAAIWIRLGDPNPVIEDPNPIWIRVFKVPIRQAIRKLTYEMIRRFIPVHAVQTKRRFGPKIMSFHMSVFFVLFEFIIVHECLILYYFLIYHYQ